jgi:hypothetical protein
MMSQKPAALVIGVASILVIFFVLLNPLDTLVLAFLFVVLLVLVRMAVSHG